jgi:hypothetical protein
MGITGTIVLTITISGSNEMVPIYVGVTGMAYQAVNEA